jgi:chorismate-pyruvate lyase
MALETARQDWERAARELETYKDDQRRYRQLLSALEVVTAELQTRVGQTFTLDELAAAYDDADRWALAALSERAGYEGWPRDVALVTDAAFHAYARGAVDFEP